MTSMPGSQQGSWWVHDSSDGVHDSDPVACSCSLVSFAFCGLEEPKKIGGDENMKEEEKREGERAIGAFWNVFVGPFVFKKNEK